MSAPRTINISTGRKSPPPPSQANLHEAALRHLARYGTTRAGLLRVLERRIDRWARETEGAGEAVQAARQAARAVVDRLAEAGAVDDAAFAAQRARSLTRAGRSRRAVAAHLASRGVDGAIMREAAPEDPEAELAAALATARRRRIGPFRSDPAPADDAALLRELAVLARAGFAQEVARRALSMDPAAAAQVVTALRRS